MHQIQLFMGLEAQLKELQDEVNVWLSSQTGINVVSVQTCLAPQSFAAGGAGASTGLARTLSAPSDILVCVHYTRG